MTDAEIRAAWDAIHDATPEGWYVGRPYSDERHNRCGERNPYEEAD